MEVITYCLKLYFVHMFENDVEMYGAQTAFAIALESNMFENDVEMYGAQTIPTTIANEIIV